MATVQIVSQNFDVIVTINAKGSYNPDMIDDLKARALDAYREAVAFNISILDRSGQAEVATDE